MAVGGAARLPGVRAHARQLLGAHRRGHRIVAGDLLQPDGAGRRERPDPVLRALVRRRVRAHPRGLADDAAGGDQDLPEGHVAGISGPLPPSGTMGDCLPRD